MALVGKSAQLKMDIEANINRMERAEVTSQQLKDAPIRFIVAETEWLSRELWGPLHGTEFAGHPELTMPDDITLSVQITDRDGETRKAARSTYNDCDRQVKVKGAPRWHDRREGANVYLQVKREHHPQFQAYADWYKANAETELCWGHIKTEVLAFLETCKSLNEAVKLWPDIRRYLSREYCDRLDKVVEKVKSDKGAAALEKLKAMDLDRIASSTVIARLASAGG